MYFHITIFGVPSECEYDTEEYIVPCSLAPYGTTVMPLIGRLPVQSYIISY